MAWFKLKLYGTVILLLFNTVSQLMKHFQAM
jgi:hypothetical protein